jgi:hypothetical protein
MNTIGRMMSTAILAGGLATMSSGSLSAQAVEPEPARDKNTFSEPMARAAALVVENNNWLDAHLYVTRGGVRTSLGLLTALGKRRFELPAWAKRPGEDFRVLVHLIGGRSYLTPAVTVYDGEVLEVVVQNNLALSTAVVFRAR